MSSLHDWRPDIKVAPPKLLLVVLGCLHMVLLWLVMTWSVSGDYRVVLSLFIVGSWGYLLQHLNPRNSNFVARISWRSDGWQLTTKERLLGPFLLGGGSRLGGAFFILHFIPCSAGGPVQRILSKLIRQRIVILSRGQMSVEDFARLQIFLRWQRSNILNPCSESVETPL